jgi:Protein of unknown function (DUF1838)
MKVFNLLALICLLATSCVAQKKLDLKNPEDALIATRKIQCSTKDGENCIFYWEGSVYSRIPQERDKLLFTYYGMNIRATKSDTFKGNKGYRQVSREVLIYCDPETGKPIDSWKNPWTSKENTVVHITNDPVNSRGVMTKSMGFNESLVFGTSKYRFYTPMCCTTSPIKIMLAQTKKCIKPSKCSISRWMKQNW